MKIFHFLYDILVVADAGVIESLLRFKGVSFH